VQLEIPISKVKFEDMELLLYKTLTVDLKKFDLLVRFNRFYCRYLRLTGQLSLIFPQCFKNKSISSNRLEAIYLR